MIDTTTVGKGIAFLRKQKQMTQQGLAAAVNVSHQAVSKWENGAALPDMQTMLALSRLFGVSMENILSGAVLEAAEPAVVQPAIELKLDAEELNMKIVAEADEIIDRAMVQCDGEAAPETAAEEPQATVNVGMHFDEIIRMAPYVSRDTLHTMLDSCDDTCTMLDVASIAPYAGKETLARLLAGCRHMDWDALRRMAPFVSRDTLRDVMLAHVDELTMEDLRRLAPFVSRDAIADVLREMPEGGDVTELKRLAPFMSKDALADQLQRSIDQLTIDDLLAFAPFLKKDQLGEFVEKIDQPIDRSQMIRLAKFLPREQMDRLVYRSMGMKRPKSRSAEWDVTGEWGRAYREIKDAVHTGMHEAREAIRMVGLDGVMDGINSTMKDVGGRINEAFNTAWNPQPKQEPAHGRSQRILVRIAEKALADGNWDWICDHISGMEGDLLKNVLMKAAAAGHEELIGENIDRLTLTSAERCRLAQTVMDEELWARLLEDMEPEHRVRVLDYIERVQPEAMESFARFVQMKTPLETAADLLRSGADVDEAVRNLSAEEQVDLLKIVLQEAIGDRDDLLRCIAPEAAVQALEVLLDAGETDGIGTLAENCDASVLPVMALSIAKRGTWECLEDLLSGLADVDLTEVWPIAVNNAQWDFIDEIALHADEATLCQMALALAEKGRYGELDSFIEELDPDTLEKLLDYAMAQSDWDAIERIGELLN